MAKKGVLRAIGHNIADSMASGCGVMVGVWSMNVFAEASLSPKGHIIVDFLNGEILAGEPSESLQKAAKAYSAAFPEFCKRHGIQASEFKKLEARFGLHRNRQPRFIVTIEDQLGRAFTDTYTGWPGRRIRRR
jgi:hypothetical protein